VQGRLDDLKRRGCGSYADLRLGQRDSEPLGVRECIT
jgi:hypothetical protein